MEFMEFFNSLMDDQRRSPVHHDPPKMPNFFEVDKKKVGRKFKIISIFLLFIFYVFYLNQLSYWMP